LRPGRVAALGRRLADGDVDARGRRDGGIHRGLSLRAGINMNSAGPAKNQDRGPGRR
jgi:hypothetical protein